MSPDTRHFPEYVEFAASGDRVVARDHDGISLHFDLRAEGSVSHEATRRREVGLIDPGVSRPLIDARRTAVRGGLIAAVVGDDHRLRVHGTHPLIIESIQNRVRRGKRDACPGPCVSSEAGDLGCAAETQREAGDGIGIHREMVARRCGETFLHPGRTAAAENLGGPRIDH